jgi:hypothetical protein
MVGVDSDTLAAFGVKGEDNMSVQSQSSNIGPTPLPSVTAILVVTSMPMPLPTLTPTLLPNMAITNVPPTILIPMLAWKVWDNSTKDMKSLEIVALVATGTSAYNKQCKSMASGLLALLLHSKDVGLHQCMHDTKAAPN